jgi:Family of unknown function (DUF5398)
LPQVEDIKMFGLENQKKKKPNEEFFFELEKEFKIPVKLKEIKEKLEDRVHRLKEAMRTGEDQEEFDRFGLLLNGYSAVVKVMARCVLKKQ